MLQRVLIGGQWRDPVDRAGTFRSVNPATWDTLPGEYPVSGWADIEAALDSALDAVMEFRAVGPGRIADFLEAFAARAESRREEIVDCANLETALPAEPRLRSSEFPRFLDQLRQAAAACRDRTWCRATIDSTRNIRSRYAPLGGPVVVFSPNNFPFAFNSAGGGDFAAALAAGNPVIAKANPGHPGTTRLFAEAAFEALKKSGLPESAVQLLYHFSEEDGFRLVGHPAVGATAFTGGRASGLRLKEAADRAGKPIYLEMSSVNPVFVLPGALEERGEEIADELFASCITGAGQFCTRPGLAILIDDARSREFLGSVRRAFSAAEPVTLLSSSVQRGLKKTCDRLAMSEGELLAGGKALTGPGFRFTPTLFRVSGAGFLRNPAAFQAESFGSLSVLVFARDAAEMTEVASRLEGQLTATIFSHGGGNDDALYGRLEPVLRVKSGRLLNDRMPTGVAVSPAMCHGGPFPATGHPGFTSVGIPASMLRFTALQCYDNVRPDRLPEELRDRNPTGTMWRLIDGWWTQADVT